VSQHWSRTSPLHADKSWKTARVQKLALKINDSIGDRLQVASCYGFTGQKTCEEASSAVRFHLLTSSPSSPVSLSILSGSFYYLSVSVSL